MGVPAPPVLRARLTELRLLLVDAARTLLDAPFLGVDVRGPLGEAGVSGDWVVERAGDVCSERRSKGRSPLTVCLGWPEWAEGRRSRVSHTRRTLKHPRQDRRTGCRAAAITRLVSEDLDVGFFPR